MINNLRRGGQLAQHIEYQFRAELERASGWGLCDAATSANLGVRLEMTLSGNSCWSIDIQFIETSGSRAKHNEKDRDLDMAIYMPDTALVKSSSPTEHIDFFLTLWGVQLAVEEDELDDKDPWGRLERFKSLIVETPSLWPAVRLAILERLDAEFQSELLESADEWLRRGYTTLGNQLLG